MKKLWIVGLALLTLTGCFCIGRCEDNYLDLGQAENKENYLKKNPDLSKELKDSIEKSEVVAGMNMEQVRASLGVATTRISKGDEERWYYYWGKIYLFRKDVLFQVYQIERNGNLFVATWGR